MAKLNLKNLEHEEESKTLSDNDQKIDPRNIKKVYEQN